MLETKTTEEPIRANTDNYTPIQSHIRFSVACNIVSASQKHGHICKQEQKHQLTSNVVEHGVWFCGHQPNTTKVEWREGVLFFQQKPGAKAKQYTF